jgi:hypothetical protein
LRQNLRQLYSAGSGRATGPTPIKPARSRLAQSIAQTWVDRADLAGIIHESRKFSEEAQKYLAVGLSARPSAIANNPREERSLNVQ